jgi:hypothetical protein
MACTHGASRWLVAASLFVCAAPASQAADIETREFRLIVDGKQAGSAQMTIQPFDDGSLMMRCDTSITVHIGPFKVYTYKYAGREKWKGGRVQQFDSACNDNGTKYEVNAVATADALKVTVNGVERQTKADSWLTSYWQQPTDKMVDAEVPLLDADSGRDLQARVLWIGLEKLDVAGKVQEVRHFRLKGKVVNVELWYDSTGRLVRQKWTEDGHRTELELTGFRR